MAGLNRTDPAERIFDWIRSQQTGCLFAQKLARDSEIPSWRTLVVKSGESSEELDSLQETLELSAENDETHAVVIVFQEVEISEHIPDLINRLVKTGHWWWTEPRKVERSASGEKRFAVGLRWKAPNDSVAFVLGFGPFGLLPPTRRSPYLALTVPTCLKGSRRDPTGAGKERHLCDMRNDLFTEESWEKLWEETKTRRAQLTESYDDDAAKARVTFVLPESHRELIVSPPQEDFHEAKKPSH